MLAVVRRTATIALAVGLVVALPSSAAMSTEPDQVLDQWTQALAARDDAAATVLAVGDSITEGSTVHLDERWLTLVERDLRAALPTEGLDDGGGRDLWPAFYSSFTLPLPTRGDAVDEADLGGPGERSLRLRPGGRVTYQDVVGTSVRVWHSATAGAAPLSIRIDDLPAVSVATSAPWPLEPGERWTEVSTGGEVDSSHTVVVERGDGGTVDPQFGGLDVRNGDEARGIHVIDAAHSGASARFFALAPTEVVSDWVEATRSSLVLVALGVNDWHDGVPPDEFGEDLGTIVDQARRADADVPVLLIAWPEATAPGYGGAYDWDEYVAAMADLAAENDVTALVDLSDLPVETTDGIHPSARANRVLADRLLPILLSGTSYDPPP